MDKLDLIAKTEKHCWTGIGETDLNKIYINVNDVMTLMDEWHSANTPVIKSLLADLPENKPLYKDSGLWQMRSDDMEEVLIQQGVNESDGDFIERCKASNVL